MDIRKTMRISYTVTKADLAKAMNIPDTEKVIEVRGYTGDDITVLTDKLVE